LLIGNFPIAKCFYLCQITPISHHEEALNSRSGGVQGMQEPRGGENRRFEQGMYQGHEEAI